MTSDIFDEAFIEALAKENNLPEEDVKRAYREAINELNDKAKIKSYIHVLIKKEVRKKLKV